MDNNFSPSSAPRLMSPDVFHTLNNQLQILLVSTEKLDVLTAQNQDARKQCSTIQSSARKIAELIATLAREGDSQDSASTAIQEWVAAFLEQERKREAGV